MMRRRLRAPIGGGGRALGGKFTAFTAGLWSIGCVQQRLDIGGDCIFHSGGLRTEFQKQRHIATLVLQSKFGQAARGDSLDVRNQLRMPTKRAEKFVSRA
eukprot:SAG11_NODE_1310_length_5236_cov_2.603270_5_plen_100_part_00